MNLKFGDKCFRVTFEGVFEYTFCGVLKGFPNNIVIKNNQGQIELAEPHHLFSSKKYALLSFSVNVKPYLEVYESFGNKKLRVS